MPLSVRNIQNELNYCLNQLIGKDACPTRQLVTSPVIASKSGGTRPDLPLITTDRLSLTGYGISGVFDKYVNDDGYLVELRQINVPMAITVYGDQDHDVQAIANSIRRTLFQTYAQQLIRERTECGIMEITQPTFSFVYLNTEYQESSRIAVTLTYVEEFIHDDGCQPTGFIDTIDLEGDLEELPDQLDIDVNAP